MNERIQSLWDMIVERRDHRALRREVPYLAELAEKYAAEGVPPQLRAAKFLAARLDAETPMVLPGQRIVFMRTVKTAGEYLTQEERDAFAAKHFLCEKGEVFNNAPDYETILRDGLDAKKEEAKAAMEGADEKEKTFLESCIVCIEALQSLISRYADHCAEKGMAKTAENLRRIRGRGARNLPEALQLLRALHFTTWLSGSYHNTLGRIDQYLLPYFMESLEECTPEKELFLWLEEFFLSCNIDSDLYIGMQQGDNGQSVVLGGRAADGRELFNRLSELALQASYELRLIDPKINIRVDKDTPLKVFEQGSRLTAVGLGFPQYENDDVNVKALKDWGYSEEDAREYVVAACWELVVPKVALDVVNADALCLSDCVGKVLPKLPECGSFEEFYALVVDEIRARAKAMAEKHSTWNFHPSPWQSVLAPGCIERKRDVSEGLKYNNIGVHGTGIATAVDSLAAIEKFVFGTREVGAARLVKACAENYEGEEELAAKLRNEAPKFGQDDDAADALAKRLLADYAAAFEGLKTCRGGVYRPGTGTAMYYVWHGAGYPATPDGRRKDEVIPANYSPSLFMKHTGPMSVVKSFSKPDLAKVANGGPLTLEFDHALFRNAESVRKLAMLVKTFITLGGHQLQLNTVDAAKMRDAQAHPEKHRHLIVRVWGWSGYFVELDKCYQDHVIKRIEFGLG